MSLKMNASAAVEEVKIEEAQITQPVLPQVADKDDSHGAA